MTRAKPDWQENIDPSPEELAAALRRARVELLECVKIVDELFPPAPPPKPRPVVHVQQPPVTGRQYGEERG